MRGLFDPQKKWSRLELVTCFADHVRDLTGDLAFPIAWGSEGKKAEEGRVVPWPQELRDAFRAAIRTEFSPETTGIHFTGLGPCSETSAPNVKLVFTTSDGTVSSAGAIGDPALTHRRKTVNSVRMNQGAIDQINLLLAEMDREMAARTGRRLNREFLAKLRIARLTYTLIHELGHVAGLFHEHTHPDSERFVRDVDLSQKQITTEDLRAKAKKELQNSQVPRKTVGEYNLASIMSYLRIQQPRELFPFVMICAMNSENPIHRWASTSQLDELKGALGLNRMSTQDLQDLIDTKVCDSGALTGLFYHPDSRQMSQGDQEALAEIYLGRPSTPNLIQRNEPLSRWVKDYARPLQRTILFMPIGTGTGS